MLDIDRLADAVLAGTRALIAKELAPLREENATLRTHSEALAKRLEAVEAKPDPIIPAALTLDDVAAAADRVTADAVAKAIEAYDATAREAMQAAIAAIPAPADVVLPPILTADDVREVAKAVAAEVTAASIVEYDEKAQARVSDAIAAIPVPEPLDIKAAMSGVERDVERLRERLDALPEPVQPKDGRGIKAATITPDGDLCVTYTDGAEDTLGRVRGADGTDADPADVQRLKEAVAELRGWKDAIRIPDAVHGKDGRGIADARVNEDGELVLKFTDGDTKVLGRIVGQDGRDGFDLNALEVEFDGERTLSFGWPGGERKQFSIPTQIYRGVWKDGTYKRGDVVTWGGSQFTAMEDTDAKPETDHTWRLSVKKGRNGADVVRAERKPSPVKIGGEADAG